MAADAFYVGFDLGTTNSAAAVFDGERAHIVRNAVGSPLTPSVVRIDGRGRVTVGDKARKFAERDPENTVMEFKRLMGTAATYAFPAAGVQRTAEELATEVLRSLRADVAAQFGIEPKRAVISVPALFELAQSAATTKAALAAGFERVELIQEPIASALASGWSAEDGEGYWLVYDLGGGTFDVSLLESNSGFLRVVGHDGDNFLGGRDVDAAIVDWAISTSQDGAAAGLSRSNPEHTAAIEQLKRAAEETKIELSRAEEAALSPAIPLHGLGLELDLTLTRAELERLCAPLIDRSLDVCEALLHEHGVHGAALRKVVFVGGPTMMPVLRRRVLERLGAPAADGLDPMTLVARGAAIYAATSNLDARGEVADAREQTLWLQYPPVSSDTEPFVVGRAIGAATEALHAVTLVRSDGWRSTSAVLDAERSFAVQVQLEVGRSNVFRVEGVGRDSAPLPVHPSEIKIFQGLTIADPPLSRSVGVALANDRVRVYFERGTPLPARCTFAHTTTMTVAPGAEHSVLRIPIVQGEHDAAHLCRLVGTLEIPAHAVRATLPAGSAVEVTLELDRGGSLAARALIPALAQVFERVETLLVPGVDPSQLAPHFERLVERLTALRASAFREARRELILVLERADARVLEVERDLAAARGGDLDAAQRARRNLIELDAEIEGGEQARHWPELSAKAARDASRASAWIESYGTAQERRMLEEAVDRMGEALRRHDIRDLKRQADVVSRLGHAAWLRDPDAWPNMFEAAAARVHDARDLPRAQAIVEQGRRAMAAHDNEGVRTATRSLWALLPEQVRVLEHGMDSGVR